MAYAIHIERENNRISLEEWTSAINRIDTARIGSGSATAINPATGESISVSENSGDVEVLFSSGGIFGIGTKKEWRHCLTFHNGRASFNASDDIESPKNQLHIVVVEIAKRLSARIVGDEGEVYSW